MEQAFNVLPLGEPGKGSRPATSWFDLLYPRTPHATLIGEHQPVSPADRQQMLGAARGSLARFYPAFFDRHQAQVQDFEDRLVKDLLPLRIRNQPHVDAACRTWVACQLLATKVPFRLKKQKVRELVRQLDPAFDVLVKSVALAPGSSTTTTTTSTSTTTSTKPAKLSRLDKLARKIKKHLHAEGSHAEEPPAPRLLRLARLRFEDDFFAAVIEVWPQECSSYFHDVVALVPTVLDESVATFDNKPGKVPGFEWMVKQGLSLKGGTSDAARSVDAVVRVCMRPIARRAIDHLQALLTDRTRRDELAVAQADAATDEERQTLENAFLLESLRLVVVELAEAKDWPQPVRSILRKLCRAIDWQADQVNVAHAEVLRFKALALRYVLVEAFKPYFDAHEGSRWMPKLLAWLKEATTFLLPSDSKGGKPLDLASFMRMQVELVDSKKEAGPERLAVADLRAALAVLGRRLLVKKS